MAARTKQTPKKGRKRNMTGWIIALVVVALVALGGYIGWTSVNREHTEAANLPLRQGSFGKLHDGIYTGDYAGGMYKWRVNSVQIDVQDGKVANIQLDNTKDPGAKNTDASTLYQRVIAAQSLDVDVISGATLTSKAYLKAVEDAVSKAQTK